MVNLRERLAKKKLQKPINPIEIYASLDRKASKGELRNVQKIILEKWFTERKDDKDLIIKLSTGRGKTLIGLLILQSKINSGEGPCLYLCPNNYLVQQTCIEAKNFGIDYCTADNDLPYEFENGE
ncbi:MAG: DEAD/DEAH box helicase family protein [Cyanobacteriota bacterium]|nr:DEAD/DEAH box helicase family protein [Cyanobacteriota bacterium]